MGNNDLQDLSLSTIKTASELLKVSQQTVKGLIDSGDLEGVRVGKRSQRVTDRSLRKLITSQLPTKPPANTEPRERSQALSLVDSIETKTRKTSK